MRTRLTTVMAALLLASATLATGQAAAQEQTAASAPPQTGVFEIGFRGTSVTGDEARDEFLKALREQFYAGQPVDFVSDILEEADLEQVLIERFDMAERNDAPGVFSYSIILREYTEPPEPHSNLVVEGARTTAAMAAGRYGSVLKVSEDGLITFYDHQERIWDI